MAVGGARGAGDTLRDLPTWIFRTIAVIVMFGLPWAYWTSMHHGKSSVLDGIGWQRQAFTPSELLLRFAGALLGPAGAHAHVGPTAALARPAPPCAASRSTGTGPCCECAARACRSLGGTIFCVAFSAHYPLSGSGVSAPAPPLASALQRAWFALRRGRRAPVVGRSRNRESLNCRCDVRLPCLPPPLVFAQVPFLIKNLQRPVYAVMIAGVFFIVASCLRASCVPGTCAYASARRVLVSVLLGCSLGEVACTDPGPCAGWRQVAIG